MKYKVFGAFAVFLCSVTYAAEAANLSTYSSVCELDCEALCKKKMPTINLGDYSLSTEELTFKTYVSDKVELFQDRNGTNWYVRPLREWDKDKVIYGVVVARIMQSYAPEGALSIKFLRETDESGRNRLVGSASQEKRFVSFDDFLLAQQALGEKQETVDRQGLNRLFEKPKDLEKHYALWTYLGLPFPNPWESGLMADKGHLVRLDYGNAFMTKAVFNFMGAERPSLNENICIRFSGFSMPYTCKEDALKKHFKELLKDRNNIHELVRNTVFALRSLDLSFDTEAYASQIQEFLRETEDRIIEEGFI